MIACVFAVAMASEGFYDEGPFEIHYELDGGENSPSNPGSYMKGDAVSLEPASKDGAIFTGWYTDEACTHMFKGFASKTTGDLTLYAGWGTDTSPSGIEYSTEGYWDDGVRTVKFTGTVTVSSLYYSPYSLSYFVQVDYGLLLTEYRFGEVVKIWSLDKTGSGWGSSMIGYLEFIGTGSVPGASGDVECNMYTTQSSDGKGLKLWYGIDDGKLYRVECDDSQLHMEMSYYRDVEVEPVSDVTVTVRGSYGVQAASDGVRTPGMVMTATAVLADGGAFDGWYDADGILLSRDLVLRYEVGTSDIVLEARAADAVADASAGDTVTLSVGFPLDDATWTVACSLDSSVSAVLHGAAPSYTFPVAGEYSISVTGKGLDGIERNWALAYSCDGDVAVDYSWSYNDAEYSLSQKFLYSDYLGYKGMDSDEKRRYTGSESARFMTPGDKYVMSLASELHEMASGMDDAAEAEFILKFVQSLGTAADDDGLWRYPVETLFTKASNNASGAILYSSIMAALGHNASILLFPGHVASGAEIDGASGTYYTYHGVKYRYCECSPGSDLTVGEKPDGVANRFSVMLECPPAEAS